jgi:hypothetical protein
VTAETDGQPSATATGDGGDDGVTLVGNQLTAGTAGGTVSVVASASGWLAGWIDFDGNGTFDDSLDRVVSAPVVAGSQTFSFDVPLSINGGVSGSGVPFFARFRIYPSQPTLESPEGQALTSSFQPTTGEVEDYAWTVNVTQAVVSSFVAREREGAVVIEWETSAETGTVGFFLRRVRRAGSRSVPLNAELLPAALSGGGGRYAYVDPAARPGVTYHYELIEVETSGRRISYGPFKVNTNSAPDAEPDGYDRSADEAPLEPGPSGYARAKRRAIGRRRVEKRALPKARSVAESLRAVAAGAGEAASPSRADAVKLGVPESGVYFVSLADLASQGLAADAAGAAAGRGHYALTNRGRRVAYAPAADGLLFYGQALDSVFARDNVYRFGEAAAAGPRMHRRREVLAPPPTGYETFTRTVHAEENHVPGTAIFDDPERDFWLWDWVFAGWGAHAFRFRADGLASGPDEASITVRLKGSSDTPASPDHHAVFRLNGSSIGDVSWNGLEEVETTLGFPSSLLLDGENTLEIDGLKLDGVAYSLFYLDSFDVSYPSFYRARGNRASVPAAGHASIQVSGFTRPDVMAFDVSDPQWPVLVEAGVKRLADGSFAVTLAPPQPETLYHVLTTDAALRPSFVERDNPSALKRPGNEADYLVVTTQPLAEAARELAELREDLRSQVVDIADVYDEFNHGIPSPHALRLFLAHAQRAWEVKPRYVVLAGDGSYDYHDTLGEGGNLIPPMMVKTPNGLFPSDAWFAEDEGGAEPAMVVGRLPAASAEELRQMIDKIRVREGSAGAEWRSRGLYVSDGADRAGNFPADSARLAALAPPGTVAQRIDVGALGGAAARAALLAALDEGVGSLSYVGHGGYDVLADEGLLRSEDVERLQNAGRPMLVTAMTCVASHFALPGYPSLGELLVRKEAGGAAAVWGPTGLSVNEPAVSLAEGYALAASADAEVRLGDAILSARAGYRAAGWPQYLPLIYVLLGDPAMKVH